MSAKLKKPVAPQSQELDAGQFFHIDLGMLKDMRIFPFHLYVFHPVSKKYFLYLGGNEPLTNDKAQLLRFISEKGGQIAVKLVQKHTFLYGLGLREEDIPSLRKGRGDMLREEQQRLKKDQTKLDSEKPFLFKQAFAGAMEGDNFSPLIDRVRQEILCFPVTISPTVSLARYLAEELLYEDNMLNRITAVSILLAKSMGIKDAASLGDLACAAMVHHLGLTQIERSLMTRAQLKMGDEDRKRYRQHAGLSQHLLKKCLVELSDRGLSLLQDHHEREDGSGYPANKKGPHIDILAQTLGAVSHLFEFHYGLINGQVTPIKNILKNMKNKTLIPGLETQFNELVLNNLAHLLIIDEANGKSNIKVA